MADSCTYCSYMFVKRPLLLHQALSHVCSHQVLVHVCYRPVLLAATTTKSKKRVQVCVRKRPLLPQEDQVDVILVRSDLNEVIVQEKRMSVMLKPTALQVKQFVNQGRKKNKNI